jgi:hypothetical protein
MTDVGEGRWGGAEREAQAAAEAGAAGSTCITSWSNSAGGQNSRSGRGSSLCLESSPSGVSPSI